DPYQLNGNNYKARPVTILMTPPPDLVVSAVNVPATARAGEPYSMSWTVTNQGSSPTEDGTWFDQVYLASGPDPDAPGYRREQLLYSVQHDGVLARGESYAATGTFTLSPGLMGGKAIVVETNAYSTDGRSGRDPDDA